MGKHTSDQWKREGQKRYFAAQSRRQGKAATEAASIDVDIEAATAALLAYEGSSRFMLELKEYYRRQGPGLFKLSPKQAVIVIKITNDTAREGQ